MPKKSVRSPRFRRPSHCSRKSMNSSLRSCPQRDPVFGSPLPGMAFVSGLLFMPGVCHKYRNYTNLKIMRIIKIRIHPMWLEHGQSAEPEAVSHPCPVRRRLPRPVYSYDPAAARTVVWATACQALRPYLRDLCRGITRVGFGCRNSGRRLGDDVSARRQANLRLPRSAAPHHRKMGDSQALPGWTSRRSHRETWNEDDRRPSTPGVDPCGQLQQGGRPVLQDTASTQVRNRSPTQPRRHRTGNCGGPDILSAAPNRRRWGIRGWRPRRQLAWLRRAARGAKTTTRRRQRSGQGSFHRNNDARRHGARFCTPRSRNIPVGRQDFRSCHFGSGNRSPRHVDPCSRKQLLPDRR